MAKLLIGIILGCMLGFIVAVLRHDGFFVSEPEIVRDLPVDREKANAELTKRFMEKFPAGTPVQTLTGFLISKGFRPHWQWSADEPSASLYRNGLCPDRWYVIWKVNNQRELQKIKAGHENDCY